MTYRGIKITYHAVSSYGKVHVPSSIHLLEPSEHELYDALQKAQRDNFKRICIYKRHLKAVI